MKEISKYAKSWLVCTSHLPFCTSIFLFSTLYVLYFLHLPDSETAVYEGDILLRRGRRSAINCESCLWPKSQDGLVKVPVNISSDFCECMQMDALKFDLIFQPLYYLLCFSGMHQKQPLHEWEFIDMSLFLSCLPHGILAKTLNRSH